MEDNRSTHYAWEGCVVLNPKKFQFASNSVDFAGFRVSKHSVEPLPKYLDAISQFPMPKNISDIRSWFGLVNQVSNYAQLRDLMAPFKCFLSPRYPFSWTAELEAKFNESKQHIVEAIRKGIEIFDITEQTCLRPDWSKQGIGYFLSQKHCRCESRLPGCCENGWKVTLVGSRFLHGAEQRYAAIVVESLTVAWSLEQTKYFTQGCDNLLIVTDHKALVKVLGDHTLDEISNSRLFRLKQRTLPWKFEIAHMPGKTNKVADATLRYPTNEFAEVASLSFMTCADSQEVAFNCSIVKHAETFFTIPWDKIVSATSSDPCLVHLASIIQSGFPRIKKELDAALRPFWNIRYDNFVGQDGVIMYGDRIVVPVSLQESVLQILHSGHQGVSSNALQSKPVIFLAWHGQWHSKDS